MTNHLVAPTLLSATILVALGSFAWNLVQANRHISFKKVLKSEGSLLAAQVPTSWDLPAGAFALLLKDDGTVEHEVNADRVRDTNFLKDNDEQTSRMFHKMKSRAMTGGGYVTFKWVNPDTNELKTYVAYTSRNKDNRTTCLAKPMI